MKKKAMKLIYTNVSILEAMISMAKLWVINIFRAEVEKKMISKNARHPITFPTGIQIQKQVSNLYQCTFVPLGQV